MNVKFYCDGSCLGNGKADNFGGYGVVMVVNNRIYTTFKQGARNTTNNEMELMGLLKAVKAAKNLKQEVEIFCDSAYAVNIVNDWMYNWAANNWIKKSDKKPPENLEIIKELYDFLNFDPNIKVLKVRGHGSDKFNKAADELAVMASTIAQREYLESLRQKSLGL